MSDAQEREIAKSAYEAAKVNLAVYVRLYLEGYGQQVHIQVRMAYWKHQVELMEEHYGFEPDR
jgi:hypothetical protein